MEDPHAKSRFIVLVTRGFRPNVQYASVPTRESAESMKADAIRMGYPDAKVLSAEEFAERDRPPTRSETDPRRSDR